MAGRLSIARWRGGRFRRGAICAVVLMTTTIVVAIGLAAMAASRVERRRGAIDRDAAAARAAARAAVEWGFLQIRREANWSNLWNRDANWADRLPLQRGFFSLTRTAYDISDPINPRLTFEAKGECGDAAARLRVVIVRGAWVEDAGWTQIVR
jgi:hypothetical protein